MPNAICPSKLRATSTADVEQLHARFRRPLLRLEEDGLALLTLRARLVRPGQRWIGRYVLGYASCLGLDVVEDVAKDARRGGGFGEFASSAGEH